jgi:tetratricopeptide (TPR) repeat protein
VPATAELFSLAIHHHQAGKLALAEQLYTQILQADPTHADSHHLLGVIAHQTGRNAQAVALIQQALRLNPWAGIFHSNLGVVYEALGQKPEALASYEQALRVQPQSPEAHNAVGNMLRDLGRLQESAAHCMEALRLRPGFPEAHDNLGNALYLQGKRDEAIAHYREALRFRPDFALAHGHLGLALADMGKVNEALPHYDEALRLDPNNAEAHNNMSIMLLSEGKLEEAAAHCQEALRIQPNFAGAHNNLSIALRRQGKLDEAVFQSREAVRIRPDFPEGHNSLATALVRRAYPAEALAAYHEAIRLKPHFPEARWNRAMLWLAHGNFEEGWPEYEWRWTQPGFTPRKFLQPAWDGSDIRGRTILIYTEQGFGDTLQFTRYAPLVKQCGATVMVQCQIPLVRLLAGVPGIDHLVPEEVQPPHFDLQVALISLPGIFYTKHKSIPAAVPYLHPNQGLAAKWRRESGVRCPVSGVEDRISSDTGHRTQDSGLVFRSDTGLRTQDSGLVSRSDTGLRTPDSGLVSRSDTGLRTPDSGLVFRSDTGHRTPDTGLFVAIAWQGSPTYGHDNLRSMPLTHFGRLAEIKGVQLISLQKGAGTEQIKDFADRHSICQFGDQLDEASGPFMDSAAIMKSADLVICSDSAVAHLAGALAVPVWLALPMVPDWRWHIEREDSPWYPTMRLFRQERFEQWDDVFERMARELRAVTDSSPIHL